MRVLLSTIGSRGDVQPLVALALALRESGQGVRFCAPPDFRGLVEGFGFEFVALGPELRGTASAGAVRPTVEQLRMLAKMSVDTQFATVPRAAEGCDVIVAGGYLQIAAPTVAELMGIAVVQATYCPIVLPSRHHAPPPLPGGGDAPSEEDDIADLWARDARRWNETWAEALNAHRVSAGLAPVDDVRGHILTERP
ncbi:glycosyltransferase [Sphaerisporangium sp. B11E5]|uniref:glycosyltransferase n=1 Tax=Sphaerisporangium sp. B11E5 TaxID=3153563 RepID=UPI00325D95F6